MTEDLQAPQSGGRKAALGFIFAAAVMDILALGIIIPVLPQLVRQFTHGDTAHAAEYFGLFGTVFGLMQFVCSPIIGALSDRFGRRPVLLVSIFGLGFDYLLMANAPTIGWLFVGRVIAGITAASFSTASAYIADITPPERRAKSFGLIGAAFGVGFTVGPALGGFLGHYDLRLPFWVAAGLALANGLYGLFVLPESLPKDRRARFNLAKANPVGSFMLLRSHPQLLGLASVLFLYYLAHQVLQSTFALYTADRYHWGPQMFGFNLMGIGIGNILVQTLVIGPFVARFGERGALYTGLTCGVIGFIIYATAATPLQYWCGLPVFALMGLVQPGYQGLMSRRVAPTEQGRLQGANSGLMALAGIIGPELFTGVFAWSLRARGLVLGEGTAIYLAAAVLSVALVIAAWVTARDREVVASA
ncbi:MAG: TCR/Tet family MFS transporter [Caulobacteraceae bacterium]|nr:TCR/Tet family MFS transporter [Caulobacteraceae bacterium]